MNCFLYLCPQTRENYHGKIKSDKNRSCRTRPKQQVVGRLSEALGASIITIKRDLAAMQSVGVIKRVGSDKTGHWEAIVK